MGVFVSTPRPSPGDAEALREASAKLRAVLSLGDEEVEAAAADFDSLRKAACRIAAARQKPSRG